MTTTKSLDFYRNVFGWRRARESDSPEFRYTTVDVGEEQYAGIMDASGFLPEGVPARWTVYFGVDDADHSAVGGRVARR